MNLGKVALLSLLSLMDRFNDFTFDLDIGHLLCIRADAEVKSAFNNFDLPSRHGRLNFHDSHAILRAKLQDLRKGPDANVGVWFGHCWDYLAVILKMQIGVKDRRSLLRTYGNVLKHVMLVYLKKNVIFRTNVHSVVSNIGFVVIIQWQSKTI